MKLGGLDNPSGLLREKESDLLQPRIETKYSTVQDVVYLTEKLRRTNSITG
jgi:hypothetical protein